MTGEVTLRGRVLPIGGLKEKLLAALRGGIKTVLIPQENEKDLAEIPANIKEGLEIIPGQPCRSGARKGAGIAINSRWNGPKPTSWQRLCRLQLAAKVALPLPIETPSWGCLDDVTAIGRVFHRK